MSVQSSIACNDMKLERNVPAREMRLVSCGTHSGILYRATRTRMNRTNLVSSERTKVQMMHKVLSQCI